jgi:exodeoxyribonuclease VII large subunit
VAHTRGKTPTAVAEIFIAHLTKTATELDVLQERLVSRTQGLLVEERSDLLSLSNRLVHHSSLYLQRETAAIQQLATGARHSFRQVLQKEFAYLQEAMITTRHSTRRLLDEEGHRLIQAKRTLQHSSRVELRDERHFLENVEQFVRMVSPANVLKRGYTLTLKDGKIITTSKGLQEGELIETRFRDGDVTSVIQSTGLPSTESEV